MAQMLGIYGLVNSLMIANDLLEKMPLHQGMLELAAGISVGLCGLAAGFAIGIVGDAGGESFLSARPSRLYSCVTLTRFLLSHRAVRASTQQPRLYTGMILILIFGEVLGLYGVVVSVIILTRSRDAGQCLY